MHSDLANIDLRNIDLIPATAGHQPLLSNLIQLYMHDFSAIVPIELGPDGRYEYPPLPLYWLEASRFPFLVAVGGKWAGFVLVRQAQSPEEEYPGWDMAEFFVLRRYRRHGIGTRLAHLAFKRFPGPWQIRVMESNAAAVQFWRRAIEGFTGVSPSPTRSTIEGAAWWTFRFESRSGALDGLSSG